MQYFVESCVFSFVWTKGSDDSEDEWAAARISFFLPAARLCISPCWDSWDSCQPTSPACPGPSEWQHIPLVYQPLHTILCHQANLQRLHSSPSSLSKILNSMPQYWSLGYTVSWSPPNRLVQLITILGVLLFIPFSVYLILLIQSILHLLYDDVTEDSVEILTEIQVENIHCSPLSSTRSVIAS